MFLSLTKSKKVVSLNKSTKSKLTQATRTTHTPAKHGTVVLKGKIKNLVNAN